MSYTIYVKGLDPDSLRYGAGNLNKNLKQEIILKFLKLC
jgi:hypothetical protein